MSILLEYRNLSNFWAADFSRNNSEESIRSDGRVVNSNDFLTDEGYDDGFNRILARRSFSSLFYDEKEMMASALEESENEYFVGLGGELVKQEHDGKFVVPPNEREKLILNEIREKGNKK